MKRFAAALAFLLFGLALFFFLIHPPRSGAIPPRYLALPSPPAESFAYEQYGWGESVPIRDGRFWLWAQPAGTNAPRRIYNYLYDLNQQKAVAELSNGSPIFASLDQSRLLCEGWGPPQLTLKQQFAAFFNRLAGRTAFPTNLVENFWVLDLRDNSAVFLGGLEQSPGSGSRWVPAPGFRFGFNRPSASTWGREFNLCDLDQKKMQKINLTGELQGWWDDHDLVATDSAGNFLLFDVISRKTAPLFSKVDITGFLAGQGITNYPPDYAAKFTWNGAGYDMYLSENRKNGLDTNTTFLIKAQHEGPPFKLLYRNFNLHWAGYLDETGTHYLYSGEKGQPGSGGNGGVFLRDLSDNSERVLVPPDNHNQYALARLSSNTVIFWRDKLLWRVDLQTTNASPLFPHSGN